MQHLAAWQRGTYISDKPTTNFFSIDTVETH